MVDSLNITLVVVVDKLSSSQLLTSSGLREM